MIAVPRSLHPNLHYQDALYAPLRIGFLLMTPTASELLGSPKGHTEVQQTQQVFVMLLFFSLLDTWSKNCTNAN
ncbi:hypothetical protein PBY51_007998 [Eleginops maclovinus]|uniref:Uncharacterized protein n=1 Tax=Eleginops maclovinus TaxID=56733 RepID=A0AAN7X523_ELEMC|nr:hypothetical protein PBY51_007998 [Eleginops maclovinus]